MTVNIFCLDRQQLANHTTDTKPRGKKNLSVENFGIQRSSEVVGDWWKKKYGDVDTSTPFSRSSLKHQLCLK